MARRASEVIWNSSAIWPGQGSLGVVPLRNGMLKCSDIIIVFVKLGQRGFEHYFQRFKKKKIIHPRVCLCYSGREAGDVGGGAKEADEPSEQHRGEDRQVSPVFSWINLNILLFISLRIPIWFSLDYQK